LIGTDNLESLGKVKIEGEGGFCATSTLVLLLELTTGSSAFLVAVSPFCISGLHFSFHSVHFALVGTEPKHGTIFGLHKG
jgi:hypothetical protein